MNSKQFILRLFAAALTSLAFAVACGSQRLDAGRDVPRGLLPVDARSPVILSNDGCGNWQGLYAVLFSNGSGPALAGIAVHSSTYADDIDANLASWQSFVSSARASGLRDIPEPTVSVSVPLVRPNDGDIDLTTPNQSQGARLIVEASSRLALPNRPLVVVTGGRLTDVADAYLLDHSVADRVVVVAALGSIAGQSAAMGLPNGELDVWADWIVAQRFRYVQVSAFYDPTTDVPSPALSKLPDNALGDFVAAQQPNITNTPTMADQVSIIAVALPEFVVDVQLVAPSDPVDTTAGPTLKPADGGHVWLVTRVDSSLATARLWQMLQDPKTFAP